MLLKIQEYLFYPLVIILILFSIFLPHLAQATVARPPQFVVFSFDNCTELSYWHELSNFLDEMNKSGKPLHFTFFVSGTNFLMTANKNVYQGSGHNPGDAEIDFGGTADEVKQRIAIINKLYHDGNEFGSHAVGHFDGVKWTTADWLKEFKNYNELLNNIAKNNNFSKSVKAAYSPKEIVGFRAPYLAESQEIYPALKENHFRYDASSIGEANAWPQKKDGIWQFSLVKLNVAGTDKKTLSMDYNFLLAQSGATPNAEYQNVYRDQMHNTYINYFLANYTGNRAPIRIGHHFSNLQGGAYRQALLAFARQVCGLPEVQCVTFADLADFMDALDLDTLNAYQQGDFRHAARPMLSNVSAIK